MTWEMYKPLGAIPSEPPMGALLVVEQNNHMAPSLQAFVYRSHPTRWEAAAGGNTTVRPGQKFRCWFVPLPALTPTDTAGAAGAAALGRPPKLRDPVPLHMKIERTQRDDIDRVRGAVPRSAWVRQALAARLAKVAEGTD